MAANGSNSREAARQRPVHLRTFSKRRTFECVRPKQRHSGTGRQIWTNAAFEASCGAKQVCRSRSALSGASQMRVIL
jgi:hypothetical protein